MKGCLRATIMKFEEAIVKAKAKSTLIGSKINEDTVEDILIIPTDDKFRQEYLDLYLPTFDAQKAIAPFTSEDVKVVAIFKRDYLLKYGLFTTFDL
jgi:hypothetical protein